MDTLLGTISSVEWLEVARMFIDLLIKGAMLCGLAAGVTFFMRRSPAHARKSVWVAVLVCLVLLPVASLIVPSFDIPVLPALGTETLVTGEMSGAPPVAGTSGAPAALPAAQDPGWSAADLASGARAIGLGWIGLVWLAGAVLYLVWFAVSRHLLKRLVARAVPLDASWESLLKKLSYDLGMRREVNLLRSAAVSAAITAGVIRPVIILPDSAEGWSAERRRLVLSHELAHVKRWDSLIEILGFAATALHWFNPLAWLALNRLRIERERDCDNAVLNSGAKPSAYASLLMEIATDMQRRNRPMWQMATISEGSNLKDRLLCILDPKVNRRSGSRASVFMIGVLIVAFTIPLSGSHIWKRAVIEISGGDVQEEKAEKEEQAKEAQACEDAKKKEQALKEEELKKAKKVSEQVKPKDLRAMLESDMKDDKARGTSAARVIGLSAYDHGPDGATKVYKKAAAADGYYFEEKEFNNVGYILLKAGKAKEAVTVFQMNVDMYPDSWNVYDSLGEAYLALGNTTKATSLYEKSLELNPENENGKKMLAMIEKKYGT
jgi:beta-lactamase regulating signal transducer with metallopeptidase domain/Flp pilus assembly protein TadD